MKHSDYSLLKSAYTECSGAFGLWNFAKNPSFTGPGFEMPAALGAKTSRLASSFFLRRRSPWVNRLLTDMVAFDIFGGIFSFAADPS